MPTSITHEFLGTIDWSRTALGPMDGWPCSLRGYVAMILELPTPAILFWGPEQTQIYNDGYAVIMGPRHPRYFGAPYKECWPDTYPVIHPWMQQVREGGKTVEVARAPFALTRHGFPEEAYFTFTFSALRDDEGHIAGIYQPVVEMTETVLRERRLATLQALSNPHDPMRDAVAALTANAADVPFSALYLSTRDGGLELTAFSGFDSMDTCASGVAPVRRAIEGVLVNPAPLQAELELRLGPWPEPVRSAFIVPIASSTSRQPIGVAVLGISPRLRFDDSYQAFFESMVRELGIALNAQRVRELEQRLIERERAARRESDIAREAAEQSNRTKDEFFAILGHELRNPLAPITSALHLMRQEGETRHARERAIIERQVAHITRLVDDLLDVSRITQGKVALNRIPLRLAEIVSTAIETTSSLLEQRRLMLEVHVPSSGLIVDGDRARLVQVVTNLLSNAAKYTHPGGRVRVSADTQGEHVRLRVEDTGVGMAQQMLSRVFDPFSQAQQSLDRAQGGLGLGLTIVSNLVRLHEGTVTAHSDGVGRGSTFTVLLPHSASSEPLGEAVLEREVPQALATPWHVLVVDDNEDAAELLAEGLSMRGHQTRVAHDGVRALELVAEHAPDVVILDIGLPVMDGYELARRLRLALSDRVHLIALTGYGQEADRKRAYEAGFDAHLVKPTQLDVIGQTVERFRNTR